MFKIYRLEISCDDPVSLGRDAYPFKGNSMPNEARFIMLGSEAMCNIQWNGGETPRVRQGEILRLSEFGIPEGTSCWARAYFGQLGNHDAGDNFTYSRADQSRAVYTLEFMPPMAKFTLAIEPDAV